MIGDLIQPSSSRPTPNRRRRRQSLFSRWWVKWGLAAAVVLLIGGGLTAWGVINYYERKALDFDLSKLYELERSNLIFDRNGEEIGNFYVMENRRPVSFEDVPAHLIQALVAEEDSRFWEHNGVDIMGVGRAILATLKVGRIHQGASTITMQLAGQGFGMRHQRTLSRKLTEAFLARRIEREFNKQQIMELYLNRIYFGRGFYGINAAAIGYFGKPVNELTLNEAAVLVGLIKAPNRCSPLNSITEATKARDTVLYRMLVENYITDPEYRRLKAEPVRVNPGPSQGAAGYVQAEARTKLIELLGYEETTGGGYRVYTTIDASLQRKAQQELDAHLTAIETKTKGYRHQTKEDYRIRLAAFLATGKTIDHKDCPRPEYLQGAVLTIDNTTGAILAMVGGRDFAHSQYNRVLQGRRAAGTAFVPFVYGAAFENGWYPGSRVQDTPLDNTRVMIGAITGILGEWGSEDPNASYLGDISARRALVYSRNGAAVRLGSETGLAKVQDFAKRLGIQSALRDENKAFLGSSEMLPAEMALAYSTFANGGKRPSQLFLISKIEDHEGNVIYRSKAAEAPQVQATDEITAYQITSCLQQALQEGPGADATSRYGMGDIPAAGKTGTHSNFTDLWFAGFTSRVTTVVWAGMDRPVNIYENAFSRDIALPVWCRVMQAANELFPGEPFKEPENAEAIEVCTRSGLRSTDACYEQQLDPKTGRERYVRSSFREIIRPGYKVFDFCSYHTKKQSEEGHGEAPLLAEPTPLLSASSAATAAVTEALIITAPVVVGDYDPYNSVKPSSTIPKAQPVEDGDEGSRSSGPEFDLSSQRLLEKAKGRLDLRPPEPIKLD